MTKTYRDFSDFYDHPLIRRIADTKKWTVSDKDKRPIDMFDLRVLHMVTGAKFTNELSLVSLPRLCELLPDAANNAFYLDCLTDGFVVLDIEPTCPANVKKKLLAMPYLYGEVSLSGKGYHLVFDTPTCLDDYPIAKKKIVMKEPHGHYEILLNHWVTFTRNMLPPSKGTESFDELFERMASEQVETHRDDVDVSEMRPEMPKVAEVAIEQLTNIRPYGRTPENFHGDRSKYEYGYMSHLYRKLQAILALDRIQQMMNGEELDDNQKAWVLFAAAVAHIPHRDKHEECRDGLPWLLYLAREVIAKNTEDDERKEG